MRIVAGAFRGRRLHTPRGKDIRPTADRVREAVFSALGKRVLDAHVLDLYAGTGAMGLEALSRGAAEAVFVDHLPAAVRLIRLNIDLCGVGQCTRVLPRPVDQALKALAAEERTRRLFDLVFIDPPYGLEDWGANLAQLAALGLAATHATAVVEHPAGAAAHAVIADWRKTKDRLYGGTAVSFYGYARGSEPSP
jgi:16S rRNA (guanine966-N2)-methyltransferase